MDRARRQRICRLAHGPQSVERPSQRELGRTQTIHEIPATNPAGILHRPKDRIDGAKAADDSLGRHRFTGHHAVPFKQGETLRVETLRGAGRQVLLRDE